MAGLKFKGAAPQQSQQKPMLNVAKMDLPGMLAKQLNIPPGAVQQLMVMLKQAKSPAEAASMIKQFDRNPNTMHEQFDPNQGQQSQPAGQPAPAAGLQLN